MATSQVETVSTGVDKAKLAAAVVLLVAGLVAFYWFGKQGALVQWGALLLGVAAAVVVFFDVRAGQGALGLWSGCLA